MIFSVRKPQGTVKSNSHTKSQRSLETRHRLSCENENLHEIFGDTLISRISSDLENQIYQLLPRNAPGILYFGKFFLSRVHNSLLT